MITDARGLDCSRKAAISVGLPRRRGPPSPFLVVARTLPKTFGFSGDVAPRCGVSDCMGGRGPVCVAHLQIVYGSQLSTSSYSASVRRGDVRLFVIPEEFPAKGERTGAWNPTPSDSGSSRDAGGVSANWGASARIPRHWGAISTRVRPGAHAIPGGSLSFLRHVYFSTSFELRPARLIADGSWFRLSGCRRPPQSLSSVFPK